MRRLLQPAGSRGDDGRAAGRRNGRRVGQARRQSGAGRPLGTCFDVAVLPQDGGLPQDAGGYRLYFSWRPKRSVAWTESADGIHWSPPVIALGPNPATGWEDDVNRPWS